MPTPVQRLGWSAAALLLSCSALPATTIPRLTFEQLIDASDMIASGRVTQTWGAWDAEHKYIWTHYVMNVEDSAKGSRIATVEFAEPGGNAGGSAMMIPGTVRYAVGESVVVFLSRMPNGYLRTTGWAQGKYGLDAAGRLHGSTLVGAEMVNVKDKSSGAALNTLEGVSLSELKRRVAARVGARTGRVK